MSNSGSANAERKICAGAIIHSIFIHFVLKMIRRARQYVPDFIQTHEKGTTKGDRSYLREDSQFGSAGMRCLPFRFRPCLPRRRIGFKT